MANLISQQSVFGADPTDGFVAYTLAVKPYHCKLLEVLIEHIYKESVTVNITEKWRWSVGITSPDIEVIPMCESSNTWDSLTSANDYIPTRIIKAVGETPIEVIFLSDPATPTIITVSYNPDNYIINIGDPITFQTTGSFPNTTVGPISPGLVYYVYSINGDSIEVSKTSVSAPLIFVTPGTGTTKIHQENLLYNSFLVEQPVMQEFECAVANKQSNQLSFVNTYNILNISPLNKTITVSGHLTAAGSILYIHNNTGNSVDGQYTISLTTVSGSNTIITVHENILNNAQNNGVVHIRDSVHNVPHWFAGIKVRVSSSNALPYPLEPSIDYYFIPTTEEGIFTLSTKRFPKDITDMVDISTLGGNTFNIRRTDVFFPGAIVSITNSHLSRNNGIFYIRDIKQEGNYARINTLQKVPRSTPPLLSNDGVMNIYTDGEYNISSYCGENQQAPDLHTSAFIDERITFEFVINFNDMIKSEYNEDNASIFNLTLTSIASPAYSFPGMGLDTQFFDMGVLDEDTLFDSTASSGMLY